MNTPMPTAAPPPTISAVVLMPPLLSSVSSELFPSGLETWATPSEYPETAEWNSELLVPNGPSRPMVVSFHPPVGRASAAADPAKTPRAAIAAITPDQLLIRSPGSKRTQNSVTVFATHRPCDRFSHAEPVNL
jgi:hypothetical protein